MLFFGAEPKYKEYQKNFDFILDYLLVNKEGLHEFVFSNPKQLFLDNKVEEPVFMSLDDLIINNYGFHQERYLKGVNWEGKLFYYCEKQYDITFYHIVGGTLAIKDFIKVYNFKSWSIKRNLTKKERSFVYKFVNGLFKNRYSYNFDYMLDIQEDIKELEYNIYEFECIDQLVGLTSEEWEELEELEEQLKAKKKLEDKLIFSISEE